MSESDNPTKAKRGFASMNPEKLREISKKGGQSVPPEKRMFAKDRALASAAGRKGGINLTGLAARKKKPAQP